MPEPYSYDAASNLTSITYPSGRIVTYVRNSLGKVTSVTTKANATAPVVNVASGIVWRAMSNLLVSLTHGNGLLTEAIYDNDYRPATLRVYISASATYLSRLLYTYGDGINLTFINDFVAPANSVTLSYTAANRLSTANGPWGNASYTYDAVGNRLTHVVTSGTTTTRIASYGTTNNRITGMTENGATLRSYTYDGNGNILTDTRPGEVFSFSYNKRNRPLAVARNAVVYASYEYDAMEQLVSRNTSAPGGPTGTVHYIHDLAGHVIAEADGATGTTTREYIWLEELPIGLIQGGNLHAIHTDHLARPIRVTDATKATVWQATYTPWGEPQSISGTLALDMRFPGQLFQIETGLAYNWHRHYDPVTGRYTQPDPLKFVDGPSIYAYAGASPFVKVDREGRQSEPEIKGLMDMLRGLGLRNPPRNPRVCMSDGSADDKREKCKEACYAGYLANVEVCNMLGKKKNRTICFAEAAELYATCLNGCDLPTIE